MATKSSEYWAKRFDQVEQSANNKSARYSKQLEKKYKIAMQEIDAKVNAWYQRIAANNEITVEEARRLLSKNELDEFKWNVNQYIEYGQENAINQVWQKELENASAKFHINRLEAIKLEVRQQIEVAMAGGQEAMFDTLADVYKDSFYQSIFEVQKGFGVGFDVSMLDNKQVARLLNKPWAVDGENFSKKIWNNRTKLINTLDQELTKMVLTGSTPKKAIENIRRSMNTSLANAKRLVVTEQSYFTTLGQKDAFKELDVEEFEIVATLDSITSEVCQGMDGQHFLVKDMQPGVNAPPFHPYCRTTTCPYFNDEFSILDKRSAKGEDGQWYEIPGNMTYPEWKKSFVDGGSKEDLDIIGMGDVKKTKMSKVAEEIINETDLPAQMEKANALIDDYTDVKSQWSGKVVIDDTLNAYGKANRITRNITVRSTTPVKSKIHELLHCRTNYDVDSAIVDFVNENVNEGVTELLAELICDDNGIPYVPSYTTQVEALKRIASACKYSEMEFAKELFEIPYSKRYNWIETKVYDAIDSDIVDISTQATMLNDLNIMYGK